MSVSKSKQRPAKRSSKSASGSTDSKPDEGSRDTVDETVQGAESDGADASEADAVAKAPRRRRRRSRRRASEAPDAKGADGKASSIPLDANGRERPYFLTQFPEDPELDKLCSAFEAGDYSFVRQHAEKVARETGDDEVRRAALELFERIKPDPLVKYMLLVSIGLLLFLVIHAYASHGH